MANLGEVKYTDVSELADLGLDKDGLISEIEEDFGEINERLASDEQEGFKYAWRALARIEDNLSRLKSTDVDAEFFSAFESRFVSLVFPVYVHEFEGTLERASAFLDSLPREDIGYELAWSRNRFDRLFKELSLDKSESKTVKALRARRAQIERQLISFVLDLVNNGNCMVSNPILSKKLIQVLEDRSRLPMI